MEQKVVFSEEIKEVLDKKFSPLREIEKKSERFFKRIFGLAFFFGILFVVLIGLSIHTTDKGNSKVIFLIGIGVTIGVVVLFFIGVKMRDRFVKIYKNKKEEILKDSFFEDFLKIEADKQLEKMRQEISIEDAKKVVLENLD